uniref:IF rod domain-containing protein n=1 Tax=Crocodylus porosus TaxID=8502 RepID=A0A7M4FTW4_CROPO
MSFFPASSPTSPYSTVLRSNVQPTWTRPQKCKFLLCRNKKQQKAIATANEPRGFLMGYEGAGCFSSRSLCGLRSGRRGMAAQHTDGDVHYGSFDTSYGLTGSGTGGLCTWAIAPIIINKNLLQLLDLEISATASAMKHQGKEELKSLNSKLACFITKVSQGFRILEQHNIGLKTKWDFIQKRKLSKNHTKPLLTMYISNLEKQIDFLDNERSQLKVEMKKWQVTLEHNKTKYEEEYRQILFIRVHIDFRYLICELSELQSCISDTAVTMQMNNSRGLDTGNVINGFRARYNEIVSGSRAEAEAWYQRDVSDRGSSLGWILLRNNPMSLPATVLPLPCCRQEKKLADTKDQEETAVKDAMCKVAELKTALQKAKQDMARQLWEHQELMNVKLVLDIDIVTYWKLLEGEEYRDTGGRHVSSSWSHRSAVYASVAANTTDSHRASGCWITTTDAGVRVTDEPTLGSAHSCKKRSNIVFQLMGFLGKDATWEAGFETGEPSKYLQMLTGQAPSAPSLLGRQN